MKEEFAELIAAFKLEITVFKEARVSANVDGMCRSLATLASINGAMRTVREIYGADTLDEADFVERADKLISTVLIKYIVDAK